MIHIEHEGAVTVLRIEQGKVQAMDLELMTAVSETLDELRSLRPGAVILTGTALAAIESWLLKAESMLERAKEVADRLASAPMSAFESCKRQLRQPFIERAARFNAEDGARILEQLCSPETHAIIRAYLEKTIRKK